MLPIYAGCLNLVDVVFLLNSTVLSVVNFAFILFFSAHCKERKISNIVACLVVDFQASEA